MSGLAKTESGLATYVDPGADTPFLELATVQCVHCGGHFFRKPGALVKSFLTNDEAKRREAEGKTIRGWCMNCNGPVCGPGCAVCVPTEQYLENLEKGRAPDFKPTQVFVPHNFE